jgi:hypothetical protein
LTAPWAALKNGGTQVDPRLIIRPHDGNIKPVRENGILGWDILVSDKLLVMGEYDAAINDLLGSDIEAQTIYRSIGLPAHMLKRKHYKCLRYIDHIPEIIKNPDYVGLHDNKDGTFSVEYIKVLKLNVLVAVKVDSDVDYLYVSTVYDIQDSKIQRRLFSGKIKQVVSDVEVESDPDKRVDS